MPVTLKKLTWQDRNELPETHARTELVDGDPVVTPVPCRTRRRICEELGIMIRRFALAR